MRRTLPLSLLLFAILASTVARGASAQCSLQWQPGDPIPHATGTVHAALPWDPDGAGPAPQVLVVGGRFAAGTMAATSLAAFDGSQWSPIGLPPICRVTALATFNGQLIAAGNQPGCFAPHTIAAFDGTAWSVLGSIPSGIVHAMAVWNGSLFVGGSFTSVTGTPANNIAEWNGTAWSQPGAGVQGFVYTLAVFGSLHVGGSLQQAGGLTVSNHAIWNGTSWAPGASFNFPVRTLVSRSGPSAASTFLFAGGEFGSVNGVPAVHVARFTTSTGAWTAIAGLPGTSCRVLHVRSTGLSTFQLTAAVADPVANDKVFQLNGTTWLSLGGVFDLAGAVEPTSLAFWNGQYALGLTIAPPSAAPVEIAVRLHDGTVWQAAAGPGFDQQVIAIVPAGNDVVVGGAFTRYAGVPLNGIARGNPGSWQPLGSGVSNGVGGAFGVLALCALANGDIVAGGLFTTAGGSPANCIARWDGSSWSALGAGTNGSVHALLRLPNGDVIAGGNFTLAGGAPANRIARWNGTSWAPLGTGTSGQVKALAMLANGDIVAVGTFLQAGGTTVNRVARWDGSNWHALGTGLDEAAFSVASLPNGQVMVGGRFSTAGGVSAPFVARWDGSAWTAASIPTFAFDDDIFTLVVLSDGDVVAGGLTSFFGLGGPFGGTNTNLARSSGSIGWTSLDLVGLSVNAATLMPDGDLVVVGNFDVAGPVVSHHIARLAPTCPATAVPYGAGCVGSGGSNVLTAAALPWIGSTFRGLALGMPPAGIVLAVTGFTQLSVPMPAVLPQGVTGCFALVTPDLLDVSLPVGGAATTGIVVPASLALAGQVFYHQVVPLELDLSGNITAITGTNGLVLTIGVL